MASNRFLSCVNDALFVEFSSQQLSMMSYLVLNKKNTLVFYVRIDYSLLKALLVCYFRQAVNKGKGSFILETSKVV